jgi:hypothetical protein
MERITYLSPMRYEHFSLCKEQSTRPTLHNALLIASYLLLLSCVTASLLLRSLPLLSRGDSTTDFGRASGEPSSSLPRITAPRLSRTRLARRDTLHTKNSYSIYNVHNTSRLWTVSINKTKIQREIHCIFCCLHSLHILLSTWKKIQALFSSV